MKHHFTGSERLALVAHGYLLEYRLSKTPGRYLLGCLTDMESKILKEGEWNEHSLTRSRFTTRTITLSFEPAQGSEEIPQLRVMLEGDEIEELFGQDLSKRWINWRVKKLEEGTFLPKSKTAKWHLVEVPETATGLRYFMGSGIGEDLV